MKKTVISLSVFAAVGLSTQVFGQTQKTQGAVGVNTETPHATLEVETFDKDGTTNEGIMAPQLSKARVAKIKNPVEGTLVYVVDDASKGGTIDSYSGSDSKVSKITEKGYYYFNGEEWVKSSGSAAGEWVYEPTNNSVVLKRSKLDGFNRLTYYTPNGYRSLSKNISSFESYDYDQNIKESQDVNSLITSDLEFLKSSDLNGTRDNNGHNTFSLFSKHLEVDALKENNGDNSNIFFNSNTVSIPSTNSTGVRLVRTGIFNAIRLNSGNTTELTALQARSIDAGGGETNAVIGNVGNVMVQKPEGSVNKLYGLYSRVDILKGNASNITDVFGTRANLKVLGSGNITNIYGYSPTFESNSSYKGTITNYYDFYGSEVPNSINITNKYGVFIPGSNKVNYFEGAVGIGTANKPIALLDIVGGGRGTYIGIGSGKSPYGMYLGHNVYKSSQNSLFTSIAGTSEAQKGSSVFFTDANAGTVVFANFIKTSGNVDQDFNIYDESFMTVLANKNVGMGVNSPKEKLEVAGNVKATSFIGTNGAALHPDYVFQKYYTGKSSIKADYNFNTLEQVESFVKENGHLPGYASAKTIKAQGYIDLTATQLTNIEKIEELFLHTIEQDKALKAKDAKIADLEARLEKLEKLLK